MEDDKIITLRQPGDICDPLTDVLRNGARALLAQAVEAEVAGVLAAHSHLTTGDGRRRLVRHGHMPERTIQTGIGSVAVRQPRVRDRGGADGKRIRYSSTRFCRSCICAAFRAATCRKRWRSCSARMRPTSRRRCWPGLRQAGRKNSSAGKSVIFRRAAMSTSGQTAFISRRAW